MKTAILVDGGYFIKRYHHINGFNKEDNNHPELVAKNLVRYCFEHIKRINSYRKRYELSRCELYRIYYYDAIPYDKDSQNPISGKTVNFNKTEQFSFRNKLLMELKEQRKIALRLGFLKNSSKQWVIKPHLTKSLLNGSKKISELKENDVSFPLKQKAVDMKIGLDIATLAYKDQVSQIILIAGDSDFVPAAKFARREGVDFILDPMLNNIDKTLHEHIDGKYSIRTMNRIQ